MPALRVPVQWPGASLLPLTSLGLVGVDRSQNMTISVSHEVVGDVGLCYDLWENRSEVSALQSRRRIFPSVMGQMCEFFLEAHD